MNPIVCSHFRYEKTHYWAPPLPLKSSKSQSHLLSHDLSDSLSESSKSTSSTSLTTWCVLVTLRDSSPRQLGVVREFQSYGDTPESLYCPPLCGDWYWRIKARSLWPVWWGERIERDPILCGFLNGDISTFVALNFRIKYCVSSCSCCLLLSSYLVLWFYIASFVIC
jgi:hypothetical protein